MTEHSPSQRAIQEAVKRILRAMRHGEREIIVRRTRSGEGYKVYVVSEAPLDDSDHAA